MLGTKQSSAYDAHSLFPHNLPEAGTTHDNKRFKPDEVGTQAMSFNEKAVFTLKVRHHPGTKLPVAYSDKRIKELVYAAYREAQESVGDIGFGSVATLQGAIDTIFRLDEDTPGIAIARNHAFEETDTICAERRAIAELIQDNRKTIAALLKRNEESLEDKPIIEAIVVSPKDPYAANVERFGSCYKCLESMQNETHMRKNTLVIMLLRDNEKNEPYIDVAPLSSYLPYKGPRNGPPSCAGMPLKT